MVICCLLFSVNAAGQIVEHLKRVQHYLDSTAKAKVDPRYIEVPDKPWRVILNYKTNGVDVDYNQELDYPEMNDHVEWKLCFEPPMANSIGCWVG